MAITEDTANQPATVNTTAAWNTTGLVSGSFSPQAGTLVLVLLSGGDASTGTTVASVVDSAANSFTMLRRQDTAAGSTATVNEVWGRYYAAPPGSITVTATTAAASVGGQMTVRCLLGASSTQPGATGGLGNISTAAAMQASVVAGTGNMIYGAASNWTSSTAPTVLGNTTSVAAVVDATNGANWAAYKSSAGTAGTATYGYSSSIQGALVAVEIVALTSGGSGDDGPQAVPMLLPALSYSGDDQSAPTATVFPMRPWQRRFQWVTQPWLNSDGIPLAAAAGPPVYPLRHPVQAAWLPLQGGRTSRRAGVFAGAGPPLRPVHAPAVAQRQPLRGGTTAHRTGLFAGIGPALKALASAVGARIRVLPPRGRITSHAGVYSGSGPALRPPDGPVTAVRPQPARGGRVASRVGTFTSTAPAVGPALYPLRHPVRARQLPQRGGRTAHAAGTFAGSGPAVKPATGPVRAQPAPVRGGRIASRAGTFTSFAPIAGPPIYPTGHPVAAKRPPARGGAVAHRAGLFAGSGGPAPQLRQPVAARQPLPRPGRVLTRAGTLTAGGPQVGPPVYPLGHQVAARRLPVRGGCVTRRSGPYAGTGPAAPQLRQPVGCGRLQPPPPARGRVASLRGPASGQGPPVRPLQRPVRSRLPGPFRSGRVGTTLLPPVAAPPPVFSVGVLTAATFAPGTSAADYAPTGQTAMYAPGSSATDRRTGGPS